MSEDTQMRDYGGQSATARLAQRRHAFVEAMLEAISTSGWRQLTVDRLARDAGVSKRYFYEMFADLDEVAAAVVDDAITGFQDAVAHVLSEPEPERSVPELAHATIRAMVIYLTEDPRRARLLFGEMSTNTVVHAKRSDALKAISSFVDARAREIHHAEGNQDTIIPTTATFLIGGTGQAILSWLDGALHGTRDQLIDDLGTLWLITGDGAADLARRRDPAPHPTTTA